MRAFLVAWRSLVSFYNEMFLLLGVNLLWWVAGGFTAALALFLAWSMFPIGDLWWLAPLVAIPAGPATAALANVTHRAARDRRVDLSFFTDGLREYWRKALALAALLTIGDMLLLLNILFYAKRPEPLLALLSLPFIVLLAYWLAVQIYAFPILVAMKEPAAFPALKMAAMMAFANPLFSALIIVIAGLLTGLTAILAILLLIVWPGIVIMLGSHALKLVVEMAGIQTEEDSDAA
ncbi:MAG: hypothetical protein ACP5UQ_02405 [Anaerolineae bacterium]